jgi:hypothetical protein
VARVSGDWVLVAGVMGWDVSVGLVRLELQNGSQGFLMRAIQCLGRCGMAIARGGEHARSHAAVGSI